MKDRLGELRNQMASGLHVIETPPHRNSSRNEGDSSLASSANARDGRGGVAIEMDTLLPSGSAASPFETFLLHSNNLRERVDQLYKLADRAKQLHGILITSPVSEKEYSEELNEIDKKFAAEVRDIAHALKELKTESQRFVRTRGSKGGAVEARMAKDHINTITKSLELCMNRFTSEQLSYKERTRKKFTTYMRVVNSGLTDEQVEEAMENGNVNDLMKGLMLGYTAKQQLYDDVKTRYEAISQLEKSISELYDLFAHIATMVEQQSEIVDSIAHAVENAAVVTERANENVRKAVELQRSVRKKKIIIAIALFIILILLLVLGYSAMCFYLPFC